VARRYQADWSLPELFQQLRADYDAARPSIYRRTRQGVVPSGTHADYHYRLESHYFGMMELARDIMRNNVVVGQGVRRFVANIIQEGFLLDPQTGDEDLDNELAELWTEWTEEPDACDLEGERTFHDLESHVLQQVVVDGDIIPLPTVGGQLQVFEAHRMRTPTATVRNVIHGVLVNEQRRRLEYWITREDVGLLAAVRRVADVQRYPVRDNNGRRQVLHLYRPDRMSQTRGVTALAAPADTAGMGDDLFFAQLVKAQAASCFSIFREIGAEGWQTSPQQHGEATTQSRPDGTTRRIEGVSPGMEVFGFPGEKLHGFSPNIPNPEFFQHAMLILTFIAINLDMPLAMFLLDPTKTNFSGWRGATDQAKIRFRDFQRWLRDHFHRPVYLWKLRQWLEQKPGLARRAARKGVRVWRHDWGLPTWPYIEPLKDATADLLTERNSLNSPRRIQSKNGRDFWKVTDETIEDNAYRVRAAKKMAAEINSEFPQDLDPVRWRDLISVGMPQGVTLSLSGKDLSDQQEAGNE